MMYVECELSRFDGTENAWVGKRDARLGHHVKTPDGRVHFLTAVGETLVSCRKMKDDAIIANRVFHKKVKAKI